MIVYSARKWCRLALASNPTVLLPLFVSDVEVMVRTEPEAELVANAERFVSRLAANRYLGHLSSQRTAMTGEAGAHTNRPQLVAVHGYDTKYAMNALRLGVQGVELLSTSRITLPVPEPARSHLRAVRGGEVPFAEVLAALEQAHAELRRHADSPPIPRSHRAADRLIGALRAAVGLALIDAPGHASRPNRAIRPVSP